MRDSTVEGEKAEQGEKIRYTETQQNRLKELGFAAEDQESLFSGREERDAKFREMEREGLLERVGKSGIRILDREGMQKIFIGEDVY